MPTGTLFSGEFKQRVVEDDFAGKWLVELAFGDLKDEESEVFHSLLGCLNHIAPALWVTCGRADVALTAYNERNGL